RGRRTLRRRRRPGAHCPLDQGLHRGDAMTAALVSDPSRAREAADRPLNVADHLRWAAEAHPESRAIVAPGPRDRSGRRAYFQISFRALDALVDRWARGLVAVGVKEKMRVLVLVKPSFELFGLTYALFRIGAVPVLLDPGMGRARVLGAIR